MAISESEELWVISLCVAQIEKKIKLLVEFQFSGTLSAYYTCTVLVYAFGNFTKNALDLDTENYIVIND